MGATLRRSRMKIALMRQAHDGARGTAGIDDCRACTITRARAYTGPATALIW